MRYITETKNLLDINSDLNLNNGSNITINGNSILCVALAANAHVSYRVPTVIGEKYTVSNKSVVRGGLVNTGNFGLFLSDNSQVDSSNYLAYGLQSGQSFTLTASSEFLYIHWYICYPFDSNNPSTIEINELQVELGDTATPYVPYGYLPMRRMKYKVSNVCQLLDKRTYPATGTRNGITFTHNGDGSYTANGTFASSDGSYFYFITNEHKNTITLLANHKYLVLNGAYYEAGTYSVWMVVNNQLVAESNGTLFGNDFNAKCYTPKNDEEAALSMRIVHKTNADTINFTFKPQLFDLTEMYGAGHEPTTVEQFRQDFPEEMYDYSPRCWASMKNIRYLEKTKNLFDYSKVNNLMYIGGYSVNQYFIKNGNRFTVTYPMSKGATYLDYIMPLKAGTYTLSLLAYGTVSGATKGYFGLVKVENDYKVLKYNKYAKSWLSGNDRQSYTLTIEEDGNYAVYAYSDYANSTNLDSTFWDIQLELGDTATDYVPYGYLPLK